MKIDGSVGEGGGQILGMIIALAILLQKPIEIYNIRANRLIPGLRPQDIHAIKILTHLFNAKVENLHIGSTSLRFIPNPESLQIQNDKIEIDSGPTGSIPMILQTIIPIIALSKNYIEIKMTGETDVIMNPTIDYIQYLASDAYKMVGIEFSVEVLRRGYHPLGGGIVQAKIFPCKSLGLFDLLEFKIIEPKIVGVCSRLPRDVLDRQISSALLVLEKNGLSCNNCTASIENSLSPGSSILIYSKSDFGPYIGGDSVWQSNKMSEEIGKEAVNKFLYNYFKKVSTDYYLADMLVLPASVAKGRSRYMIGKVTKHLITNLYIVSKIVGCNCNIVKAKENYIVNIHGKPI